MRAPHLTLTWALALALTACSIGGPSTPSRFYVLEGATPEGDFAALADVQLGVGPLQLAGYLDRPQMVTRTAGAEVAVAEAERWAEPLADLFLRALGDDLAALTGSPSIRVFPWPVQASLQYRVSVRLLRFDTDETGTATLVAQWELVPLDAEGESLLRRSELTAPADDGGTEARVRALDATVAALAEEIAAAIAGA